MAGFFFLQGLGLGWEEEMGNNIYYLFPISQHSVYINPFNPYNFEVNRIIPLLQTKNNEV